MTADALSEPEVSKESGSEGKVRYVHGHVEWNLVLNCVIHGGQEGLRRCCEKSRYVHSC